MLKKTALALVTLVGAGFLTRLVVNRVRSEA